MTIFCETDCIETTEEYCGLNPHVNFIDIQFWLPDYLFNYFWHLYSSPEISIFFYVLCIQTSLDHLDPVSTLRRKPNLAYSIDFSILFRAFLIAKISNKNFLVLQCAFRNAESWPVESEASGSANDPFERLAVIRDAKSSISKFEVGGESIWDTRINQSTERLKMKSETIMYARMAQRGHN